MICPRCNACLGHGGHHDHDALPARDHRDDCPADLAPRSARCSSAATAAAPVAHGGAVASGGDGRRGAPSERAPPSRWPTWCARTAPSFLRTHPTSGEQRRVLRAIARCRTAALGGHVEGCDGVRLPAHRLQLLPQSPLPEVSGPAAGEVDGGRAGDAAAVPSTSTSSSPCPMRSTRSFGSIPARCTGCCSAPRPPRCWAFARDPDTPRRRTRHHHGAPYVGTDPDRACPRALRGERRRLERRSPVAGSATKRRGFLFPVKALSKMFRGKYLAALDRLPARQGALRLAGQSARLAEASTWLQLLTAPAPHHWVVYAKPPFGGPERVLKYLSRYTHRVAISNRRLLFVGDGVVRFTWKDYADHRRPQGDDAPRRRVPAPLPAARRAAAASCASATTASSPTAARKQTARPLSRSPWDNTLPAPDIDDTDHRGDRRPRRCRLRYHRCPACGAPLRVIEIIVPTPCDDTS